MDNSDKTIYFGGYYVLILGSKHFNFSTVRCIRRYAGWTDSGSVSPKLAHQAIEAYTLQFFSHYLLHQAGSVAGCESRVLIRRCSLRTGLLTTHRHSKGAALTGQGKTLERSSLKRFRGGVNREGSDEVIHRLQLNQGPVERNVCVRSHGHQGRGTLGMNFHIKPVQRQIQAHTFSLEKSLLAGPTAIKTGKPQGRRKAIQGEHFAGREMIVRDLRARWVAHVQGRPQARSHGSRQGRRGWRCESG